MNQPVNQREAERTWRAHMTEANWDRLLKWINERMRETLNRTRGVIRGRTTTDATDDMLPRATVELLEGEFWPDCIINQDYGFKSRLPKRSEVVAGQVNGWGGPMIVIATATQRMGFTGLEVGDACIYTKSGTAVIVRESGDVEITPGATGKVILAGGGAAVARDGDSVQCTLTAADIATLANQMVAAGLVTVGGGGTGTPPTGVTATGTITSGSAKVEAG